VRRGGFRHHRGRRPAHPVKASDTKFEGRLSEREINVYSAPATSAPSGKKYAEKHGAFGVTEQAVRDADPKSGKCVDGASAFNPIWIVDFPMFEYDLASAKWMPAHHPFTAPKRSGHGNLLTDPASVRANCYDLAMNGLELGSGSIRIHRKDVQQQIFSRWEFQTKKRAPVRLLPRCAGVRYTAHGGIALGSTAL